MNTYHFIINFYNGTTKSVDAQANSYDEAILDVHMEAESFVMPYVICPSEQTVNEFIKVL